MDWAEIGTQLVLGIIGLLITGLGTVITYVINKYVKDAKLKNILSSLNETAKNAASEVYQTYVEALKDKNMFTAEAQKEALNKALEIIKNNLPSEVMQWVTDNYSDIDAYFKSLIESAIGLLKNTGTKKPSTEVIEEKPVEETVADKAE